MARLQLEFHPDARLDALEPYDWYAERSQQAADAFQQELQDAGRAIQCSPERWANYLFGTRRYVMKRYPFVLVYRVATERIELVAIAHAKRNPGYWKERLDSR